MRPIIRGFFAAAALAAVACSRHEGLYDGTGVDNCRYRRASGR
jgi:hypothetical protein